MTEASDPLSSTRPPPRASRCNFGWMIKYVNLTAITVLTVLVGFMFFQLQYITYEINQDRKTMAALSEQVNTQQADQIEVMDQKIETNQSLTIFQMAGTFVLLTCLLTMFHMTTHLRNYHEPVVQRKVIAILWMSPIYAVTSFLSLVVPVLEGYLSIVKDFYEAYVIYTFLAFLIAVLGRGDRALAVETLAKHADHLKNPTRCFRRLYHPPPEESPTAKANAVLLECQILAMQFVFCRPLTSVASFVVSTLIEEEQANDYGSSTDDAVGGGVGGSYSNSTLYGENAADTAQEVQKYFMTPQFWISMIQNVSVFLAFAGLIKFYHAVAGDLSWIRPFSKFLCIKGVVFMTFWQGLAINIIVSLHAGGRWEEDSSDGDPRQKAMVIQNVLICLEMLFFSIAHWCVFPSEEWQEGFIRKELPKPGIGFSDFVSDMSIIVESSKQAKLQRRNRDGQYAQAIGSDDLESPDELTIAEAEI